MTFGRSTIETTILRTPGSLYQETTDNKVRNLYTIRIVNKSYDQLPIQLKLKQPIGEISIIGPDIVLKANELAESVFFVDIDKSNLFTENSSALIEIYSGDKLLEEIRTNFRGPKIER